MEKLMTYPLSVALDLSPVWGAVLETDTVWVRVVPGKDWRVSIGDSGGIVHTTCGTRETCMELLQAKAYPLDDGWVPDLPLPR